MGSTCHTRTVCLERMAHRHAELPNTNVYCHNAKHCKHSCVAHTGLWYRNAYRRRCHRHVNRPMVWFPNGSITMSSQIFPQRKDYRKTASLKTLFIPNSQHPTFLPTRTGNAFKTKRRNNAHCSTFHNNNLPPLLRAQSRHFLPHSVHSERNYILHERRFLAG